MVRNKGFKQTINISVIDINKSSDIALLKLSGSCSKLESDEVASGTVIFNAVKQNWAVNSTSNTSVDLEGKAATLANASGIERELNFNNKLLWNFNNSGTGLAVTQVVFDNSGNITSLTGDAKVTLATDQSAAANATVGSFATKTGDSLKFAAGGKATVTGSNIVAVSKNGLVANSDWKVTDKEAKYGASSDATYQNWTLNKAGAVLSTDNLGAIASVSCLAGRATVVHGYNNDKNFAINFRGNNRTLSGDKASTASFDSVGNASIGTD